MKFGLAEAQINEICTIMAKFPEIRQAIIFGSRAMGNYKEASDVDIALKGDTTFSLAAKVKYELEEETYLPFFFDVLPYEKSNHVKLKAHIDQYGISFYRAGWKKCTLGDVANIQTGPFGTGSLKVNFQSANILPRFMAYYFSTSESRYWLTSHANLNSKILRRFPISLPPIEEQKAIAAVLSSLDDKIDLLHRQNTTLEGIAQTLFRHWFVDEAKEPDFRAFAINTMTGSSGRQRVQTASLYNYELGCPSPENLAIFKDQVTPIEKKLNHNGMQTRTLEKLRDMLLPKLMSGAVRIRF